MGAPRPTWLNLLLVLCSVGAFNIDTKFAVVKELPDNSAYFGYSVAQHAVESDSTVFNQ